MLIFGINHTANSNKNKGKKMRTLLLAIITISIFAGCSAKEINSGVDSVTGDIKNAFEKGKDKSAN
ncbi:MAG: hypothetical protein A2525_08595 [Sulfurimonas sp. RIFOXYD12_FULL_36_11]|jgi:PBP1b-binding outer membrane lipoprotein LpoB|nr:MAG: hypothetical protein A2345_09050 [Sulfurimonas sp. RIFOXYB12_FULL_35_9]OHE11860.1 MAG: hypothetical protein A2525_08595 [Sulfurimonas sp. RIFOXYD12_FULL_36_11]